MAAVQTHDRPIASDDFVEERESLNGMLHAVVQAGGSDLHITAGAPPTIRLHGSLHYLHGYDPLQTVDTAMLLRSVVSEAHWE
jgi:twitching motility protein PilT